MANSVADTRARLMERYEEQVEKGRNILNSDPGLLTKMNEFKRLIRDMSVDLKNRKTSVNRENENLDNLKESSNMSSGKAPKMDLKEIQEKKVKQLADLEAGLKVDKQKTMMLVGMILVLLFLQAGSFVFM